MCFLGEWRIGGVFSGGVKEWVSGGVLSVVIVHLSSPIDEILARMSGMLDLSSEENAKHLLPR